MDIRVQGPGVGDQRKTTPDPHRNKIHTDFILFLEKRYTPLYTLILKVFKITIMSDLFNASTAKKSSGKEEYSAHDIEVLEGLEPVRRRPGMYIGGTDENAMHHLVAEVLDNAMDEAVAGHASRIEIELQADGNVIIRDNGRGIPIDPHPKFPKKSALEVIMTTLHSGGKFSGKAYQTSGGLHGVGISVVNALSDMFVVEVVKDKVLWRQHYSKGTPLSKLTNEGTVANRKGTTVTFHPDPEIFGNNTTMKPKRLYQLAKSKAYLYRGVEIRWSCAPELIKEKDPTPQKDTLHFPNGLKDFLLYELTDCDTITPEPFFGEAKLPSDEGRVEWAVHWSYDQNFSHTYCNTIPTPLGGSHELGIRSAFLKAIRAYGEMVGNKKAATITADDIVSDACIILSLFIKDPQFQGQTKEKLVNRGVSKQVETAIKDLFDHWLAGNPEASNALLAHIIMRVDERLNRKAQKDVSRKSATQRLRLPGKLADCSRQSNDGTELFIVEGDSAGGSAKMARHRETQAILPLRGKILNVHSATADKIRANQELADLLLALGCGTGEHYQQADLRYEKIIIMTDADVDGAHIASLLMTYFYCQMPQLIHDGHLYLAKPPLFRLTQSNTAYYAADEVERDQILEELSKKRGNVEVGRFKGLGEMTPKQLKETTMDPANRVLLKVVIDEDEDQTKDQVNSLMGKNPELRFKFIREQTEILGKKLIDNVDV